MGQGNYNRPTIRHICVLRKNVLCVLRKLWYNVDMKRILLITNPDAIRRADKAAAIFAYAARHDWDVSTVSSVEGFHPGEFTQRLLADGVIIEGSNVLDDIDRSQLRKIPTVYLDTECAKTDYAVSSNSAEIARLAIAELRHSHPASILFATNTPDRFWSREREQEARTLCHGMGIPFSTADSDFGTDLLSLPKPVGVFAVHDNAALEVYAAAKAAKLNIPTDIQVVSVGNNPVYATNLKPSLTSIELDSHRAGRAAAEMLDLLVQGKPIAKRHVRVNPSGIVRRASSVKVSTNYGIREALFAIREHACDGLSVTDVAKIMGMSRRSAEIAFTRETGSTIYETILRRRFDEVERLLRKPGLTLGLLAARCGWQSQSHLARVFRQRYGKTMSEWRRDAPIQ